MQDMICNYETNKKNHTHLHKIWGDKMTQKTEKRKKKKETTKITWKE